MIQCTFANVPRETEVQLKVRRMNGEFSGEMCTLYDFPSEIWWALYIYIRLIENVASRFKEFSRLFRVYYGLCGPGEDCKHYIDTWRDNAPMRRVLMKQRRAKAAARSLTSAKNPGTQSPLSAVYWESATVYFFCYALFRVVRDPPSFTTE